MIVAVCDNDSQAREKLIGLIQKYCERHRYEIHIDGYDSGSGLCEHRDRLLEYQMIFLDAHWKGTGGLKIAKALKKLVPDTDIVLVADSMDYAIDGYKVGAARFLLKDTMEETIEECLDALTAKGNPSHQVVEFSFVEGVVRFPVQDLIYVENSKHRQIFYTNSESYSMYRKLDEIEEELKAYGFVRAHQSFLINMRYIQKISSYVLTLLDGKQFSVPKARYAKVKKEYLDYKGIQ